MSVLGPRVLGHATNIIVAGLQHPTAGIDFHSSTGCCSRRSPSTSRRRCWRTSRPTCSTASCSAPCGACGPTVEDKLNRLPLRYFDRQPRGDLLSRVTNDIDNVAQSLQQTLSQLLTSTAHGHRRAHHDAHHLAAAGAGRADHDPGLAVHHQGHRQALEGAVHRAVEPHRLAQRAGRGGLHRPRAGEGVRPPARGRGARSTRRTRSSSRPASAPSSSPGSSSRR